MGLRRLVRIVPLFMCSVIAIGAAGRTPDGNLDLTSLSEADLKAVTIRLERMPCYGTCPAYSITIHGDGRVEYDGKSHVAESGKREGQVEQEAIKALVTQFAKAKYLELPEDYSEANCSRYCTDMPTAVIELSAKGVTHRVKHYYGCGGVPNVLFELESMIDKSANVQRWTGDVSRAGPFGTTCWSRN